MLPSQGTTEDHIVFKTELKGEVAKQFLMIKKRLNIEANVEVVRWIIGEQYRATFEKKAEGKT